MRTDRRSLASMAPRVALAGLLALGLAACDSKPALEKLNSNIAGTPLPEPDATQPLPAAPEAAAPRATSAATDSELAQRVKSAIVSDPGLKSLTVDVNAHDGVVTLYGTADTPDKAHQAALLAMDVDGVRSVKNDLVIVRGS